MKSIYWRAIGDMGCFTIFAIVTSPLVALAYVEHNVKQDTPPSRLAILVVLGTVLLLAFTGRWIYVSLQSFASRFRPERLEKRLTPKNVARLIFAITGTVAWRVFENVIGPIGGLGVAYTIGIWWVIVDLRTDQQGEGSRDNFQ